MATRTDIQFAVCLCARYQASLKTSHYQAVKHIFRYLKFTPELGVWYSSEGFRMLTLLAAGLIANKLPTHARISLVSWSSRKQGCVSLSTTEAEYIVVASCCSQLLWMMSDFGLRCGRIPLLVDSTSTIFVAKNSILHSRTKHID
ncbi:LOW QUALITY PROTEIN: hypothetical protein U9M48_008240, partial [Paspalum notatum var. saurae]